MTRSVRRRGLVVGVAVVLAAGRAWGQGAAPAPGQSSGQGLEELHGDLTARNAGDFGRFVSQHAGRVLSLRVAVRAAEGRAFSVGRDRDMLMVRLERPEAMEIVLHDGFAPGADGFVLDGVFAVKAEGMQQGILIYGLERVGEAQGRELRAGPVQRIALS